MTVKELMELLKTLPEDAMVFTQAEFTEEFRGEYPRTTGFDSMDGVVDGVWVNSLGEVLIHSKALNMDAYEAMWGS